MWWFKIIETLHFAWVENTVETEQGGKAPKSVESLTFSGRGGLVIEIYCLRSTGTLADEKLLPVG